MNYSIEILLEQKTLLEDEIKFTEGEELEETKQKYTDVCVSLNKLNLDCIKDSVCPKCGYPRFKKQHEDFERCEGCEWTSQTEL